MGNGILQLQGICKSFGGIQALKNVDFELRRGEIHALLGENGAGKSTLIKILTGVHQPDDGKILLKGKVLSMESPIDARKKGIAAIYQELSLIDSLTVAENIFLGNEPTATPLGYCKRKQLYVDSEEFLRQFGISIDPKVLVGTLGLGQKRIIEIVKALAVNADILLLDEPTTGMSKAEIDTLFQIMKKLKEKSVTMIYISHYLDEVFRCCDRSTVLRDGRNVNTFEMKHVTVAELVTTMIGHSISAHQHHSKIDYIKEPISVEATNFQSSVMQKPISFNARQGEIVGFTGIVGSGKSELASSLFGVYPMLKGKLTINGEEAYFRTPYDTRKYGLAFVPEDRKAQGVFLNDTIADNIVLPHLEKTQNSIGLLDNKKKLNIARKMSKTMQIHPMDVGMLVGNLSGGNQQKVVIGKWLTGDPQIVLLDEPTRGIDIGAKEEIYRFIAQLSENRKTVIIFSSEIEELLNSCDRIYVLYKGAIVGEMPAAQSTVEKILTLALGGTNA